ncbi:MAG: hypothetical protein ACRDQD_20495 [Nocardioidaceae bacterium]
MLRRLSVILVAGLALTFGLSTTTASAAPVTTVHHEKGLVETFVDVLTTCEPGAPLYRITTTSNLVEKETVFDDGRFHGTFTQTGKAVANPLNPALPSYTGRFTAWGGFNANTSTTASTFTFSLTLKGSDGSKITEHELEHSNTRPDGSTHEFFRCH